MTYQRVYKINILQVRVRVLDYIIHIETSKLALNRYYKVQLPP